MAAKKNTPSDEHGDYSRVERHIATPEELAEHRDFVARSRKLRLEIRSELLKKYPDKYVGLPKGGELLVADSMDELVAKVKDLGELQGLAWVFLNTKPRVRVVIR